MKIPFEASPNYSKGRRAVITTVVIHAMSGFFEGSRSWFKNRQSQVSAHYLISKKGEILQMVKDEDTAWHCGNGNSFTIGIELEDASFSYDKTGKKTLRTCMNDSAWFSIIQLDTAAELVVSLMRKHKIEKATSVIGHDDPSLKRLGNDHRDPGPYFPWIRFRKMIAEKLARSV